VVADGDVMSGTLCESGSGFVPTGVGDAPGGRACGMGTRAEGPSFGMVLGGRETWF
jgi:hypothetical protein